MLLITAVTTTIDAVTLNNMNTQPLTGMTGSRKSLTLLLNINYNKLRHVSIVL